jgi:hypothetical protein
MLVPQSPDSDSSPVNNTLIHIGNSESTVNLGLRNLSNLDLYNDYYHIYVMHIRCVPHNASQVDVATVLVRYDQVVG